MSQRFNYNVIYILWVYDYYCYYYYSNRKNIDVFIIWRWSHLISSHFYTTTILLYIIHAALSFTPCVYYEIGSDVFLRFNIRVAITPREWHVGGGGGGGVVNIGVDIKFIAEQRKHRNAIMSLLVRLISQTLRRYSVYIVCVPRSVHFF